MKNKFHRFLLFLMIAIMSAFTFVPPAHQIPETNRFIPEMVYELPPVATITFVMTDTVVKQGDPVCLRMTAEGFEKILTMQYSMHWDPQVIKFKQVSRLNLPGLTDSNFGLNTVKEGTLTFSWYDPGFTGVSRPSDSELFTLCFEAVGKGASSTKLTFDGKPTPVEVADSGGVLLDLHHRGGEVKIQ